jgi:hypothetical protein
MTTERVGARTVFGSWPSSRTRLCARGGAGRGRRDAAGLRFAALLFINDNPAARIAAQHSAHRPIGSKCPVRNEKLFYSNN